MPQNATRGDFTKQIRRLHYFLGLIADRPMEFNTACRALAQEALEEIQLVMPEGPTTVWRDRLTVEQRNKILKRPLSYECRASILNPKGDTGMDQATKTAGTATTAQEVVKTNEAAAVEVFMIEVESSNLARVGFHGGDVLRVQFKNKNDVPGEFTGDMWDYKGIAQGEFVDLVNSDSAGKTYNALTKNRGIKGTKAGRT